MSAHGFCDGSIDFEQDLIPILKTNPVFATYILTNFTFYSDPWGTRIGREAIPALGGARIGPYRILASYKTKNGEKPINIIINTHIRWFNKDGSEQKGETLDLDTATKRIESLDSITIEQFPVEMLKSLHDHKLKPRVYSIKLLN